MKKLRCSRCKEVKPESEFSFRYKSKGIRQLQCKSCCKAYGKQYYKKNSDRWRRYVIDQRTRAKEEARRFLYRYFLTHYCVDCREADPIVLEFDHVTGVKDKCIATMIGTGYRLERIEAEVAKCEVRCRNCHIKRHSIENNIWIVQMIKAEHELHGGN